MNKNSNITRQNIYDLVYRELGISKVYCSNFVDSLFDKVMKILDNKVEIRGFGTFSKKYIKARVGRNPKTKEEKIISSRNVVSFKPSKFLIKKINRFADKDRHQILLEKRGIGAEEIDLIICATASSFSCIKILGKKI